MDPAVLEGIEGSMDTLIQQTGASAVMLADRSGVVVVSRGDQPQHPDQLGATTAGVFGAMKSMIRASRADAFSIRIPSSGASFFFQHVDDRLFLMAFFAEEARESVVADALRKLAETARPSLTTENLGLCIDATTFIEGKLNEILKLEG